MCLDLFDGTWPAGIEEAGFTNGTDNHSIQKDQKTCQSQAADDQGQLGAINVVWSGNWRDIGRCNVFRISACH